jgi:hypothetical protein
MGDDAEYYIEQQEEEARFQKSIKDEQEREMTRKRILREKKIESEQKNLPVKK